MTARKTWTISALIALGIALLGYQVYAQDNPHLPPPPPLPPFPPPTQKRPIPDRAAAHDIRFPPTPVPSGPSPADSLAWDAVMKDMETKPGQMSADFFFAVTNISATDIVIDHVQTSCGCTVAKLPSQPWTLKPQDNGKISVTVDLKGKPVGTMFKTITVFFTNQMSKPLTVKVTIPDSPENTRLRNQQMATMDREKVFRDDCAHCHAEPTHGKTGKELFAAACGICHDAEHRATMVPDLHALNHSTDRIYWKQWIATGKVGSAMPGFSVEQGGPLSNEQIDSLVDYLDSTVPHDPPARTAKMQLQPGSLAPAVAAPVIK
jgi:cytochrome c553